MEHELSIHEVLFKIVLYTPRYAVSPPSESLESNKVRTCLLGRPEKSGSQQPPSCILYVGNQKDVFRHLLAFRLTCQHAWKCICSINQCLLQRAFQNFVSLPEMARVALAREARIVFHHATKRRRSFFGLFQPSPQRADHSKGNIKLSTFSSIRNLPSDLEGRTGGL